MRGFNFADEILVSESNVYTDTDRDTDTENKFSDNLGEGGGEGDKHGLNVENELMIIRVWYN